MRNKFAVIYALLVIALVAAPFVGAYPVFVMKVLCFALYASAFNLLLGFTGLLSFGHAAFFGGSAYVAGYAMKVWGVGPEIGLAVGAGVGAILGWVFGVLAIRRQGIYFAMVTLALAQMVYFIAIQAPFTGGEDGLQGVPRGKLLGIVDLRSDLSMYYFALAVVGCAFLFIVRIVNSPFGQVLRGLKENEPRTVSLGYDVDRFKLIAFVLSASLSGLAGALKTLVLGFATLGDVHWTASGQVVLITMVGGMGTLAGPIVGSAVVVSLENKLGELGELLARVTTIDWFNTMGESVSMIMGLIFIFCVLAFRRGITGEAVALMNRDKSIS